MFLNPQNFPESADFIRMLPLEALQRLVSCGFNETQVLFFEIPYCAITGAGAGIARAVSYTHLTLPTN